MFKGTGIALITPFTEAGKIDLESLEKLVNYNIDGGVDFLVAMGTTAESATLTNDEKAEAIACILNVNKGRLPVVLGVGGNNTAEVVRHLKTDNFAGIDGILSVSPYYNRPSQEGIYQHFKAVADASPLPIIAYNVPSRTGSNMTATTIVKIAKDCEKIVAIKEAAGSINQAMEIIKDKPADLIVLSGDDNLTIPMMHMGAEGVISVSAQAYPSKFKQMMNGDLATKNSIHYQIYEFTNLLFAEGNPAGLKAALKHLNVISSDQVRLPLVRATKGLASKIQAEMDRVSN